MCHSLPTLYHAWHMCHILSTTDLNNIQMYEYRHDSLYKLKINWLKDFLCQRKYNVPPWKKAVCYCLLKKWFWGSCKTHNYTVNEMKLKQFESLSPFTCTHFYRKDSSTLCNIRVSKWIIRTIRIALIG